MAAALLARIVMRPIIGSSPPGHGRSIEKGACYLRFDALRSKRGPTAPIFRRIIIAGSAVTSMFGAQEISIINVKLYA